MYGKKIEVLNFIYHLNNFLFLENVSKICVGMGGRVSTLEVMHSLNILRRSINIDHATVPTSMVAVSYGGGPFSVYHPCKIIGTTAVHGTSNMGFDLHHLQKVVPPVTGWILPGAKNPCTVLSLGAKFDIMGKRTHPVLKVAINAIIHDNPEMFDKGALSNSELEYTMDLNESIEKIFGADIDKETRNRIIFCIHNKSSLDELDDFLK